MELRLNWRGKIFDRPVYIDQDIKDTILNYDWKITKCYDNLYYSYFWDGDKIIFMRRFIYEFKNNKYLNENIIDHHNGNTLDNQIKNLRICTHKQNSYNRKQLRHKKYKGVVIRIKNNNTKYEAAIQGDGKYKFIGLFDSEIEAAIAYDIEAFKLYGEFAWLNIPQPSKEIVSKVCSQINQIKKRDSSSKFLGVFRHGDKWDCSVYHNGKTIYIGRFINETDAAKAYDSAAKQYKGSTAKLNFPEMDICKLV